MPASKLKRNYTITEGMTGRDLFRTPRYATTLLMPFIPDNIKMVWECASGPGHISKVLEPKYKVISTDIVAYPEIEMIQHDFLGNSIPYDVQYYLEPFCIITNPPFSIKKAFYNRCIELDVPFALLIPGDYTVWICDAIRKDGCEKIIPTRRVNYITPTNKPDSSSKFHSLWLTRYFNLGKSETFVDLTKEMMKDV